MNIKHISFIGLLAVALVAAMPQSAFADNVFSKKTISLDTIEPAAEIASKIPASVLEAVPVPVENANTISQAVTTANANTTVPVPVSATISSLATGTIAIQGTVTAISNNGLASPDPITPVPAPTPTPAPAPVANTGGTVSGGGTTQGYAPLSTAPTQPTVVATAQPVTAQQYIPLIPESEMVQGPAKAAKKIERSSRAPEHYAASVRGISASVSLIGLLSMILVVLGATVGYREYTIREAKKKALMNPAIA